jgi:hypothetical protein
MIERRGADALFLPYHTRPKQASTTYYFQTKVAFIHTFTLAYRHLMAKLN